jgi:arsenate reductase
MSQALFERIAQGRHESRSAGTHPAARVHPVVVEAMQEIGIDVSQHQPRKLTDDLAKWADLVVTMGCGDECPYIPGTRYIDWELADPANQPLDEVRKTRDEIGRRVRDLSLILDSH